MCYELMTSVRCLTTEVMLNVHGSMALLALVKALMLDISK